MSLKIHFNSVFCSRRNNTLQNDLLVTSLGDVLQCETKWLTLQTTRAAQLKQWNCRGKCSLSAAEVFTLTVLSSRAGFIRASGVLTAYSQENVQKKFINTILSSSCSEHFQIVFHCILRCVRRHQLLHLANFSVYSLNKTCIATKLRKGVSICYYIFYICVLSIFYTESSNSSVVDR